MSDLISDIGISLAKTDILRALEDARNAEARLAKKMVEAGKDPLPPLFFTADEHKRELAKLAQPKKPKPQFYWGTINGPKRLRDGELPPAPAPDSNARLFVAQVRAALADSRISLALLPKILEVLLTLQDDDEPDAKARHKVESFMFETRFPQHLTEWAAKTAPLQSDYIDCWASIEKKFDGAPGVK